MGKTLIVAEKPSVANDIAKVLGVKKRGNGCIIGEQYIITWAFGHLVTLKNPEEMDEKYKRWAYSNLPIIPEKMELKLSRGGAQQFYNIKNWMHNKDISSIICATDAGREGELIFRLIYEHAECDKPFKRLWISSMTDEAILQGFKNLKGSADYDTLFYSARCRAHADWLVGMNGSRVYSLTYDRLISIGRVQSPTLAVLVKREKERLAFESQSYYELWASFNGYKGRYFDENKKENPHWILEDKKEEFEKIAKELKGKTAVVESVEQTRETKKPPLLYDLTSLQREANYYFSFSAAKTLSLAQGLYEKHKLITYPRTDSRFLTNDMGKFLKSRAAVFDMEPWAKFAKMAQECVGHPKRVLWDARVTDHHAIIPTGKTKAIARLKDDDRKLFDLIVRRYLAVFLENQELLRTKVLTRCENRAYQSNGLQVIKKGFSEIYDDLRSKTKSADEQNIPELKEGDERKVTSSALKKKKTKPPARYTDATLLSAMEHAGRMVEDEEFSQAMKDSGLGTPATRASIIERLIQVRYVRRSSRFLVPTEKGMTLISILPTFMSSPETTGKWEKALSEIRYGKQSADEFMNEIKAMTIDLVKQGKKKVEGVEFPGDSRSAKAANGSIVYGKCPSCDGEIKENSKAYYCTNWRIKKCKFTIWKNDKNSTRPEFNPQLAKKILEDKKIVFDNGLLEIVDEEPYTKWTPKDN